MPQGVKATVIEIIQQEQAISEEEAIQIQLTLEKSGRWNQETW